MQSVHKRIAHGKQGMMSCECVNVLFYIIVFNMILLFHFVLTHISCTKLIRCRS